MSTIKNFLTEIEHEKISTQKLLDLVPENNLYWQPHPKAMTIGQLALHVASILGKIATYAENGTVTTEELVFHPNPGSKAEILSAFKNSLETASQILGNADENWENKTWELTQNETAIFSLPRVMLIRLLMLNHWYHHRGQLTSYLRNLNIPLPSVYGPSADENPFA